MKIALLKSRLSPRGGLEKVSLALASAFVRHNSQVTFLSSETKLPQPQPGITVVPVAMPSKWSLLHYVLFDRGCNRYLAKNPFDVVFGLERTTNQTHYRAGNGVHAVYLKQRALVDSPLKRLSFAINPLHRYLLAAEKKAFEHPSLKILITNSAMVREEILATYAVDPKKIHVIHSGVEWNAWESPFAASLERAPGPFRFLFIGNGYRRKGLPFLLKGFAGLPRGVATLTVIGKDREQASFEMMARSLGVSSEVIFKGAQSDILPYYQNSDCLVLPSIYDPFANVTLEALAMGLPVVTSSFNGGKEVLTTKTGQIIENLLDPDSVSHSLKWALARPKTSELAHFIRNSVKELDFSTQLDKMVRLTLETAR